MSTILFPAPIFGPVHSRRLGVSLGVNLLPADGKLCTFDCIYCECGFNAAGRTRSPIPTRQMVTDALADTLQQMHSAGKPLDVITFAGNGEPTCHPHFAEIIDDTLRLRDNYFPKAKVSVLTNATLLHVKKVHDALMRVDNNIVKLDTVNPNYINNVDRPTGTWYDVEQVIEGMKRFNGHAIIQTMFLRGTSGGVNVDNTGEEFVAPWLERVKEIAPQSVMIYTIDRETPQQGLIKAPREVLDAIRDRVISAGIPCSASY